MTGKRARPHKNATSFSKVDDIVADPYAYFLESNSEREYKEQLALRNLEAEGDPDRGNSFDFVSHSLKGNLLNVTKIDALNNYTDNYQNCLVIPASIGQMENIHKGYLYGPAPYMETGLDAFAQQAYTRAAPTAMVFDAAVFLGELKEGLPRMVPEIWKASTNLARSAGSDFLNIEFGWKPLIADIQKAARALMGSTETLSQMGKRYHRRYSLPPIERYDHLEFDSVGSILTSNWVGVADSQEPFFSSGTSAGWKIKGTYQKSVSSQRWFEGEFTHFFPLGFDPENYFHRISVLLNPRITPSTLWELAPWSWLVDWNLRIGDTIRSNEMAANDRLIMHYGYAMEKTLYRTGLSFERTSQTFPAYLSTSGIPQKGAWLASTEYKKRLRANPYGFRTGGAGVLTGNQQAILAALALTKRK